jgi:predicted dehydrogenase
MKTWKIGIVGLSRGRGFVNVFSGHPRVEVAALCDLDEKLLADTGEAFALPEARLFHRFEDFLQAPMDAVMIATPIPCHAEQTIAALEDGKHVLCEQTAAYTIEECEAIVQTVKRTGKAYMMAENCCYYHYILEWKKIVEQGRLGQIVYAEAEYIHEIADLLVDPKTGERYWRHERPPMWYCAHSLGPVLTLMDDRVVQAMGAHSGFHRFPEHAATSPGYLDMEVGLFRTQKGAVVKVLRSQVAVRPYTLWYSLYGTKGCVENGRTGKEGLLYVEGETPRGEYQHITAASSDPAAPPEAKQGGHGTSEYYMIRDFLDALDNNTRPAIDVMRAMDFTVPGIIAHQSATSGGGWLDVPLFDW